MDLDLVDHVDWHKNLDLLVTVIGSEDLPLMEQIPANLDSGALPELVYGRSERRLHDRDSPTLVHR